VVGHTDNVGSVDSNMNLSGARAAAVVKALVQKGIDASRLGPHGAGPYAPVASNSTDVGRGTIAAWSWSGSRKRPSAVIVSGGQKPSFEIRNWR